MAASQTGQTTRSESRVDKARKIASKYTGAGQSFRVKYLGTQEVSSANGDAVVADCLKEMKSLFRDLVAHLPKVTVTLQFSGITVIDEKSQLESIKAPLDQISYVCLDPADSSIFSFIVHSSDTISSKGLRLHAFVTNTHTAITFNRSVRELFDFMARIKKAKRKLAQEDPFVAKQQQTQGQSSVNETLQETDQALSVVCAEDTAVLVPPPLPPPSQTPPTSASSTNSEFLPAQPEILSLSANDTDSVEKNSTSRLPSSTNTLPNEEEKALNDEWERLEKELSIITKDLDISASEPATSTPFSSPPPFLTYEPSMDAPIPSVANGPQPTPFDLPQVPATSSFGGDPFDSSFFNLSFGPSQPLASGTSKETVTSHAPQIFDNPTFDNHSKGSQANTGKSDNVPPLASNLDGKRAVYASRPRPRSKHSVDNSVPPLSTPATSESQNACQMSLSSTGEEQLQDILNNSNPFQSPLLQQPPVANAATFFQSSPMMTNPSNPNFFMPSMVSPQSSMQLSNPLYQSYSHDSSFSVAYTSPSLPVQVPAVHSPVMKEGIQLHPFVPGMPPSVGQAHPGLMMQPQTLSTRHITPGDILTPIPPPVALPCLVASKQDASGPTISPSTSSVKSKNKTDNLFSDLIPALGYNPDKVLTKKEFEKPKKKSLPSLSELQENTMKWTAFEAQKQSKVANAARKESSDGNGVEWPMSPFDDGFESNESRFDKIIEAKTTAMTAETKKITSQIFATSGPQIAPSTATDFQLEPDTDTNAVMALEAAFNQAKIDSTFVTEHSSTQKEQTLPSSSATNDPFIPVGAANKNKEQPQKPWVSF